MITAKSSSIPNLQKYDDRWRLKHIFLEIHKLRSSINFVIWPSVTDTKAHQSIVLAGAFVRFFWAWVAYLLE